jgi:hypothetical protein
MPDAAESDYTEPDASTADPFDRYKKASIAHQALQDRRWKLDDADADSDGQAREAALAAAATELVAARDDYLREPNS